MKKGRSADLHINKGTGSQCSGVNQCETRKQRTRVVYDIPAWRRTVTHEKWKPTTQYVGQFERGITNITVNTAHRGSGARVKTYNITGLARLDFDDIRRRHRCRE
jgi:hypothetical protein